MYAKNISTHPYVFAHKTQQNLGPIQGGVAMTTQHSWASPASLNFIPTCVSVSKSGRQEGWAAAHRQRAGVTRLSTAEQQLKKKGIRKKRGRQLGHKSPPRVQETAHSSGTRPKEAGISLLLEKLTSEQGQKERGLAV